MKQTIGFAWLLFAALLLFALVFPFATAADGTYTVTVMVRFDESGGSTIADDGTYVQVLHATKLTANTYSFSSSSGEMLELVSNPVAGYQMYRWELDDSVAGPSTSYDEQYTVDAISGDSTITLVLRPLEYHISYENEAGFNGASLSYTTPPPDTHTYGQTTTLVAPRELQTHTFQYWTVYSTDGSTRTLLGTREAGATLGANEITSDLVLVAHWEPKSFSVTRHDGYLDGNNDFHEFGTVSGTAEYASSVSGLSDNIWNTNPTYRGYVFDAASAVEGTDYTVLATVSYVAENNHVYRYYTARAYTVEYEDCEGVLNDWGNAGAAYRTHIYDQNTVIPNPARTGYTFGGWEIVTSNGDLWNTDVGIVNLADNGDGTWTLHGKAYDSSLSGEVSVKLRALWNPITYTVTYDPATLHGNDVSGLPSSCAYNVPFIISPSMSRMGYTFLGWRISGTADDPVTTFVIPASDRTEDVTLEAVWNANTYTVTLDTAQGSQTLTERGTESVSVTFDAALPAITPPACEGWDFTGYYLGNDLYYNVDGTPAVAAWIIDAGGTLSARWRIQIGEWKQKLDRDFASYRGGENVEGLLLAAKTSAEALDPSAATFEEQLQAIYLGVAARVGFEKSRDDAVAELRAYYDGLVATEAYNENGSGELKTLLANAINAINSTETASEVEVQRLALAAHSGMDAVLVNYLSSVTERSEVHMTSHTGVPKGTELSVEQGDVGSVRSQIRAALRRGTVTLYPTYKGHPDAKSARKLLSSMDAVALYRMSLSVDPEEGDALTFRLPIPENLRSDGSYVVAYYDNRTETVTVLETERIGNELVFYAPYAADFVVFREHVTKTAPVLAILSCVLLLQIAAIAVLLLDRYRARARAVAFPLLAVVALRVSPSGSLTAVWILIALAIVLQGVLVYLILSAGWLRRRKERELPDADESDEFRAEPDEAAQTDDEREPLLDIPTEDELPQDDAVAAISLDPETTEADNAVDWTGVRLEETTKKPFDPLDGDGWE